MISFGLLASRLVGVSLGLFDNDACVLARLLSFSLCLSILVHIARQKIYVKFASVWSKRVSCKPDRAIAKLSNYTKPYITVQSEGSTSHGTHATTLAVKNGLCFAESKCESESELLHARVLQA